MRGSPNTTCSLGNQPHTERTATATAHNKSLTLGTLREALQRLLVRLVLLPLLLLLLLRLLVPVVLPVVASHKSLPQPLHRDRWRR